MRRRYAALPPAIVLAMALAAVPGVRPAEALTASEVRARIEAARSDLRRLAEDIERAEQRMTSAEASIRAHSRALRTAQEQRSVLRVALGRQAAELYMMGTLADVAFPATVSDVPRYVDRMVYLEQIHSGEFGLIEEIRALQDHADTESVLLRNAREIARTTLDGLTATRTTLAARLGELATLYAFLEPRWATRASRSGVRGFWCPVVGPNVVSNNYGDPRPGGPHTGDDIQASTGQPVRAVLPAVVVDTPYGGWIGIGIVIRDLAGNEWWYAHLGSRSVSIGERVRAGEIIGRVGCTGTCWGSHLHFEWHPGGGGPRDPYALLSSAC